AHDFVTGRLHLMNETRLIKRAAVRDDSHGLSHLQWSDLSITLANGKVRDIAIQNLAAMGRFHVLMVRHAPLHFAAQRDAALGAKAKPQRPIDDRLRAGFDADLIKP